MISRTEAEELAKKFQSTPEPGGKHMKVHIRNDDGVVVKTFGFSHSQRKLNPHIPRNLGISKAETLDLAECNKSREWYLDKIAEDSSTDGPANSVSPEPLPPKTD